MACALGSDALECRDLKTLETQNPVLELIPSINVNLLGPPADQQALDTIKQSLAQLYRYAPFKKNVKLDLNLLIHQ